MMTDRRLVPALALVLGVFAVALNACADDTDSTPGGTAGTDAGTDGPVVDARPPNDGAPNIPDSRVPDAPVADATSDSGDAGPIIMTTLGATGRVRVMNDSAEAAFFDDDNIVRISNAPECVIRTRATGKPTSRAGTLTVGGTIVGADGGAPQKITVPIVSTSTGALYQYFGTVFPTDDTALTITLDRTAFLSFPSVGQYTLSVPPTAPVTVTKPPPPPIDEPPETLGIPSAAPFALEWTPPAGIDPNASLLVDFARLQGSTSRVADVLCGFPVAGGTATIPASVMTYVKSVIGSTDEQQASGVLEILVGFRRDVTSPAPNAASFIYEVTRFDSTFFGVLPVRIQ